MPVDILWLYIRSLQACLWIFRGYIYEAYRHACGYSGYIYEVYRLACGYSVVTNTKFTNMPVDILWLHIRSLQTCLWIFCGYRYTKFTDMNVDILWLRIYEVYRHTCRYFVVTDIRSLHTCLCGYIHEVYRHACGYSVVTDIRSLQTCLWIICGYRYTKFTDIPVDILWLHT
jgi:hypothetical protein